MASEDNGEGSSSQQKPPDGSKAPQSADDALKKFNMRDIQAMLAQTMGENPDVVDPEKHKFWGTQPVPRFDQQKPQADGPLLPADLAKVRKEPIPLLDGFEWVTMDLTDQKEIDDTYELLFGNYVEDAEAMFRFKYSLSFLNWALKSPGWKQDWHVGIRATKSRKLVAFISGVPIKLRVRDKTIQHCSEVNFLCIHKKLRNKRLTPVLVKEITRRCNVVGTWQAIYTAGVSLTPPISVCRYFHRSLDWPKLNDVGFSPLPANSTRQRQILRYKLPEKTSTPGLRRAEKKDVPAIQRLLKRYLDRFDIAQDFSEEEVQHWFMHDATKCPEQVIWTYVVEVDGRIHDFFSFYNLESTVIGHPRHDTIRAAYLFYYATEEAFKGDPADKSGLKKRLNELMRDALILAKSEKFDVFNALSLLDNPLFLENQLFGPGDGKLNYYIYNWHTERIFGGLGERNMPDPKPAGGVGMVML